MDAATRITKALDECWEQCKRDAIFRHYWNLALDADRIAQKGHCKGKWDIAATKYDLALKYSSFTQFQKRLTEEKFIADYQRWLDKHPEVKEEIRKKRIGEGKV